ncbi:MAG: helix-turn-helix domain-containing protein [Methanomassiliicoccales archaeon]
METKGEKACMIIHNGKRICIIPSETLIKIIGKKYTLLIIGLLGNEERMNFNSILRNIEGATSNLVSQRLREMESAGLVDRKIINSRPIRVEYSLTARGRQLREQLIPLFDWIERSTVE